MHVDQDLELDFIREFSTGGESLQGLSTDNRRERIRIAIYTHKLVHALFRDGPMTYAEAYAECFGRSRCVAPSGTKRNQRRIATKSPQKRLFSWRNANARLCAQCIAAIAAHDSAIIYPKVSSKVSLHSLEGSCCRVAAFAGIER
jgi:hypothetical protein